MKFEKSFWITKSGKMKFPDYKIWKNPNLWKTQIFTL